MKKTFFGIQTRWENGKKITRKTKTVLKSHKKKAASTCLREKLLGDKKLLGKRDLLGTWSNILRRISVIKRLKWEFLRRNQKYKEEHAQWLNLRNPTRNNILRGYRRLFEKWKMPPYCPDQDSPLFVAPPEHPHAQEYFYCHVILEGAQNFMYVSDIARVNWAMKENYITCSPTKEVQKYYAEDFSKNTNPHDMNQINVTINLLYPKRDIFIAIETILKQYDKKHAAELLPDTRSRMNKYFDFLEVYDLKRQGKTYQQIIDLLHLKSKTGNDVLMTQVSREYQKAVGLIKGGYKHIS